MHKMDGIIKNNKKKGGGGEERDKREESELYTGNCANKQYALG